MLLRINIRFQLIGGDWMYPYVNDVAPLLDEAGVRILIYVGTCRARLRLGIEGRNGDS